MFFTLSGNKSLYIGIFVSQSNKSWYMKENDSIQFQLPSDVRPQIEESEYHTLQPYIDSVKAFARGTYKSLYIIDYYRMNFLYICDNPLFLCDEAVEDVLEEGYNFYLKHVPEPDLLFLQQVNRAGFEFFRDIAVQDRAKYSISYNFHLYAKEPRESMLINHQITPLKLDARGNIWLALCVVSLAPSTKVGVAYISSCNPENRWIFKPQLGRWKQIEPIELSLNEKAVIRLSNQGLSVSEIAQQINRSEDSVKGYRKSLFAKLEVSNITEAISIATHRKLI